MQGPQRRCHGDSDSTEKWFCHAEGMGSRIGAKYMFVQKGREGRKEGGERGQIEKWADDRLALSQGHRSDSPEITKKVESDIL